MSRQALPTHSCNSQPTPGKQNIWLINLGRLALLLVIALALTLFLASGTVTAERLFQSPQSPPPEQSQPPAPEQPQPAQPQPEQPQPEQPQPAQPQPEQPQPAQPQPEQPAPAQAQPTTEQPSTQQSPLAQPVGEQSMPPTLEPIQPVTALNEDVESTSSADTPMVLDEAELIDSIIVSGAYLWLCCGVIFILLIPLGMLILYIRGRSKIVNEEDF